MRWYYEKKVLKAKFYTGSPNNMIMKKILRYRVYQQKQGVLLSHFLLILEYEICSWLKTLVWLWNMEHQNTSTLILDFILSVKLESFMFIYIHFLSYYKLFHYFNLCPSVKLESFVFIYIHILSYYKLFLYFNLCLKCKIRVSCSFTSISFLTTSCSITLIYVLV